MWPRADGRTGYYTFLVVGRDVASGLTDTILLFTFDTNNKSLNAISLPRDTMINTSAKGGSLKRINVGVQPQPGLLRPAGGPAGGERHDCPEAGGEPA